MGNGLELNSRQIDFRKKLNAHTEKLYRIFAFFVVVISIYPLCPHSDRNMADKNLIFNYRGCKMISSNYIGVIYLN